MSIRISQSDSIGKDRLGFSALIIGIAFLIIAGRLMFLQLIQGSNYKLFSERNRISVKKIYALRGKIFDRNGVVLVDNRPSFDLTITRGYLGRYRQKVFDFLRNDLELDQETIAAITIKIDQSPRYDSTVVLEDIPWEMLARAKTKSYVLPGVEIVHRPVRRYTHGDLGCHLLGYLRELNKEQLSKLRQKGNQQIGQGDFVGVWGVERSLDSLLRGEDGNRPVVEDAFGREIGEEDSEFLLPTLRRKEAVPGRNLYLTIDYKLQRATEELLKDKSGAAVAIDPHSGEVLALVSKPCFDLQKFSRNIPAEYWNELNADPQKPLYDRAIMGIYPPGSTFKMVVAAAGLQDGVIPKQNAGYESCNGFFRIGRETKRCWKRFPGHGPIDLYTSLVQSCDVFYYQLGLDLGIDRIAKAAHEFGFGQKTGIGINHEQSGIVPSVDWKNRNINQPWQDGETASVAIGQGYLAATPLQVARMTATIASRGRIFRPRIALRSEDVHGEKSQPFQSEELDELDMKPEHIEEIVKGMAGVVREKKGTAYWYGRSRMIDIAGKTGTAQVVKQRAGEKYSIEDHAWFVAFAPVENPRIAVTVLVEHGGHGSKTAAPIARSMIETYMKPILEAQAAAQQPEEPKDG